MDVESSLRFTELSGIMPSTFPSRKGDFFQPKRGTTILNLKRIIRATVMKIGTTVVDNHARLDATSVPAIRVANPGG